MRGFSFFPPGPVYIMYLARVFFFLQKGQKMSFQQQLYDQIRAKVAPPNEKFLLFKVAMNWDWEPDANFIHEVEHQLVGTMPALVPEGEDPFYESSSIDIYDAYTAALDSVKLDVSEEQQELNQIDANTETIFEQQKKTYA